MARTLIEVPLWHSKVEQLTSIVKMLSNTGLEDESLLEITNKYLEMCTPLENKLLDYSKELIPFLSEHLEGCGEIRVYMDGVCDAERGLAAVRKYAELKHPICMLAMYFMEKTGGHFMATENPELHGAIQLQVTLPLSPERGESLHEGIDELIDKAKNVGLVAERDRAIAEKIDATLEEGETSILFMGLGHDVGVAVEEYGIDVVRPPFVSDYASEAKRLLAGLADDFSEYLRGYLSQDDSED